MRNRVWFVMAACLFSVLPVSAEGLKRVAILDFKNVIKRPEYNHFEEKITEAVRARMREKLAYQEVERAKWREVMKEIQIPDEDLFTQTAAYNLGVAAKLDLVVYGGFIIETRKGSTQPEIRTRVRMLDIAKHKEIKSFEIKGAADQVLAGEIDKIAERNAAEAAGVLPDQKEWASGKYSAPVETTNRLSFRSSFVPVAMGSASRTVTSGGGYASTDLKNFFGMQLEFQHFGIFKEQLGLLAAASLRLGSDELKYQLDSTPVSVSLQGAGGHGALAWRQPIGSRFYLQPIAGGGVHYDIVKMSFDNKTVAAASAGQSLSSTEIKTMAPYAVGGVRLGFAVYSWLALELGGNYYHVFYSGATGQTLAADFALTFKL
ncbi:MAG: hypothetical protein JNJ69_19085 [Leptospiraceae bacterium]|nr:hypothetical protein [Leptospiraceae bacterium]